MTEEVDRCPYCEAPMTHLEPHQHMTPRQHNVYRAVVEAGPEGITTADLLEKHLPGRKPITLRSCVYSINKIIAPKCLRGRGGKYFLVSTVLDTKDTTDDGKDA